MPPRSAAVGAAPRGGTGTVFARRVMLLSLALVTAALAAGCGGKLVGRGEEFRLGQEADRQIMRRSKLCRDEGTQWLVERIGREVAARSSRPDIHFTFRVLDDKEINAYSVPGFVYVNQGLISLVNADPDILAAVIGHEIAHTTQRHLAKQIERIYGASFLFNAVASGRMTDNLVGIALDLALSGNSRQDEREADAQGLRFMAAAGYNPWAMPRFFDTLRKETGEIRGLNRYFASHPQNAERIRRCEEIIRKEHLAPEPPAAPGPAGK